MTKQQQQQQHTLIILRQVLDYKNQVDTIYLPKPKIRGIFQATVLEWGAIAFSREQYGGSLKNKN